MGWSFRRSIRLGPLKLNLSKSGIGASLGIPGFRIGKDAKGRVYQQTSVPGTGIYRRDYLNPASPTTQQQKPLWKFFLMAAVAIAVVLLWVLLVGKR